MKADPHSPRYNKVHLQDFFLFIIDDTLINVTAEMPRFQSKSNIMQEFAVPVLLRVEKEPEVVKDVVKQIVNDYAFLDRSGQCLNEFIVFDMGESIIGPVVLEV
jgi:hypothetical protein